MFPVIDVGRIVVIGIKLTLFVGFATYFFSNLDVLTSSLSSIVESVKNSFSLFSNLDLGCFVDGLGMTDFLNSLITQFILVSTFTVSAVSSLLTYRYIIKFFEILMSM
jgi:hypothetical protein